jgi:formylglycine-generating enzyme required for sulfatase activity
MKPAPLLLLLLSAITLAGCNASPEMITPPEIETGVDPERWAFVPAGEFLMGQHEAETLVDYDYEIMVTTVTNQQYADFLNAALRDGVIRLEGSNPVGYYPGDPFNGFRHEEEISEGWYELATLDDPGIRIHLDGEKYVPKPGYSNHPVTLVTWFGAREYCLYFGWRLPTEIEWEKAARGTDNRPFPWGFEIERNNANYYSSYDIFEKTFGAQGGTTPVGFFNGKTYDTYQTLDSPSPYGLYDMAGNVWQWTGDVYEDQHYRYLRGGSNSNYAYNLRVWTRNSAGPTYSGLNVGFRCARTP